MQLPLLVGLPMAVEPQDNTHLMSGMQICNQDQTPTSYNGGTPCTIAFGSYTTGFGFAASTTIYTIVLSLTCRRMVVICNAPLSSAMLVLCHEPWI